MSSAAAPGFWRGSPLAGRQKRLQAPVPSDRDVRGGSSCGYPLQSPLTPRVRLELPTNNSQQAASHSQLQQEVQDIQLIMNYHQTLATSSHPAATSSWAQPTSCFQEPVTQSHVAPRADHPFTPPQPQGAFNTLTDSNSNDYNSSSFGGYNQCNTSGGYNTSLRHVNENTSHRRHDNSNAPSNTANDNKPCSNWSPRIASNSNPCSYAPSLAASSASGPTASAGGLDGYIQHAMMPTTYHHSDNNHHHHNHHNHHSKPNDTNHDHGGFHIGWNSSHNSTGKGNSNFHHNRHNNQNHGSNCNSHGVSAPVASARDVHHHACDGDDYALKRSSSSPTTPTTRNPPIIMLPAAPVAATSIQADTRHADNEGMLGAVHARQSGAVVPSRAWSRAETQDLQDARDVQAAALAFKTALPFLHSSERSEGSRQEAFGATSGDAEFGPLQGHAFSAFSTTAGRLIQEQAGFVSRVEAELLRLGQALEDERQERIALESALKEHGEAWMQQANILSDGTAQLRLQVAQTMEAAIWSGKEIGSVRQELASSVQSSVTVPKPRQLPGPPQGHGVSLEAVAVRLAAVEEQVRVCCKNISQSGDFFAQSVAEVSGNVADMARGLGALETKVSRAEGARCLEPARRAAAGAKDERDDFGAGAGSWCRGLEAQRHQLVEVEVQVQPRPAEAEAEVESQMVHEEPATLGVLGRRIGSCSAGHRAGSLRSGSLVSRELSHSRPTQTALRR
ncbi:unnamed protein product [Polarella glacialis]|uniref:Uncharacterized protein n=1 Tax=Polarella glacialis TaxID=89957 RepID=A0A813G4C8_POLGL|nr:unnamed protein product [Polarella glacialis]